MDTNSLHLDVYILPPRGQGGGGGGTLHYDKKKMCVTFELIHKNILNHIKHILYRNVEMTNNLKNMY